jgi:hypothetical protein
MANTCTKVQVFCIFDFTADLQVPQFVHDKKRQRSDGLRLTKLCAEIVERQVRRIAQ